VAKEPAVNAGVAAQSPPEVVNLVSGLPDHLRELSCAAIAELPMDSPMASSMPSPEDYACITQQTFSTLLDLGCTSHLITDAAFFHSYDPSKACNVKTANHGTLLTLAHGTCVALVMYNGHQTCVTLRDCLHAPGAVINLLSAGRMVEAGFEVRMKDRKLVILAPESKGAYVLAEGPMLNRLFFADVNFLHPDAPAVLSPMRSESVSFAPVQLTQNLWHARLSHADSDTVKERPLIGSGVVIITSVLDKCEPCIIAKHPRGPHPAQDCHVYNKLGLVHADLCGPFPTQSPWGELHALVLLDDHTNFNAVECLRTKDQTFERFKVVIA
jgi:hypothetical protein